MNNDFFDNAESELPPSRSNYLKLKEGANRFRMLGKPITGWEYWKTLDDGTRKPIRKRKDEPIPTNEIEETEKVKFFWAFPVFDYEDESIKILELTQKSILKSLKAIAKDPDWGSPIGENGYDLVITRTGEKLDTEYQVQPKPKKELKEGIMQLYQDMHINLEALYAGEDPFAQDEGTPEVDLDKIPF